MNYIADVNAHLDTNSYQNAHRNPARNDNVDELFCDPVKRSDKIKMLIHICIHRGFNK